MRALLFSIAILFSQTAFASTLTGDEETPLNATGVLQSSHQEVVSKQQQLCDLITNTLEAREITSHTVSTSTHVLNILSEAAAIGFWTYGIYSGDLKFEEGFALLFSSCVMGVMKTMQSRSNCPPQKISLALAPAMFAPIGVMISNLFTKNADSPTMYASVAGSVAAVTLTTSAATIYEAIVDWRRGIWF